MSNVDRCGLLAEQCSRPLGRETAFWAAARLWPAPRGTRDRKDSEREGRSMRTDLRRLLGAGMGAGLAMAVGLGARSEEHTSELQSLMRISYAVFCLEKKKN